jgi:hypothetical protein
MCRCSGRFVTSASLSSNRNALQASLPHWICESLSPIAVTASCSVCDAQARALAKRQEADAWLGSSQQEKQTAYTHQLAEIQEQNEDEETQNALRQRQKNLDSALR